jgi:NAD(P)-dependent dehydrogenase (short-subunit alcohol dehydrogenase family)
MHGSGKRVAVVTGGTGALGQSVVRVLLGRGDSVHVPWVAAEEAERLTNFVGDLREGLHLAQANVDDPASVDRFFAGVQQREGKVDALCNLVGGFRAASVEDTTPEAWEGMMRLNSTTAFLCCRAAVPLMRAAGGGRIVNVAAMPAVDRGAVGMSAYAASKAAVLNLTYSLAKELRKAAITVNAVAPEILDTAANRKAMPNADTSKWVAPIDAARAIAFLAGEDSAVVTGNVLVLARG